MSSLHRSSVAGRRVPGPGRAGASARGFTLVELVVTVAIVGLLASMAVPAAEMAYKRSREQDLKLALREIRRAIDAYKDGVDQGLVETKVGETGYPPNLQVPVEGVPNQRDPNKAKIYFLRRIPRDPFSADPTAAAQETWRLRSYESEPDAPEEGKDVYDVYSRSSATGLNGVPYAKW